MSNVLQLRNLGMLLCACRFREPLAFLHHSTTHGLPLHTATEVPTSTADTTLHMAHPQCFILLYPDPQQL